MLTHYGKEKAQTVFENLVQNLGYGDEYYVNVPRFFGPTKFKNLKNNDLKFSVGIWETEHLAYLLFCNKPDAFKEEIEGPAIIVFQVAAGRNGPEQEAAFYADNVVISEMDEVTNIPLTENEIISLFGVILKESTINGAKHKLIRYTPGAKNEILVTPFHF